MEETLTPIKIIQKDLMRTLYVKKLSIIGVTIFCNSDEVFRNFFDIRIT